MASLTPLNEPLGLRRAKHLLRRATFKFDSTSINSLAEMTATDAVSHLLQRYPDTVSEPYDPYPSSDPHGYWTSAEGHPNQFDGQGRKRAYVAGWWWFNAMNELSLRHKLVFFLHTSFTVGKDSGGGLSTTYFDHLRLLDRYAYGNLRELAVKITLDNSMLYYLDNTSNNANNPNENYAREFLELFTILKGEQIGEGDYTNYTEVDVQQAAKVFSGFKIAFNRMVIDEETGIPSGYARKNSHDPNDKQFSHAFDNHVITGRDSAEGMFEELSDFVDMVFDKGATAYSYARKLYRFYIKNEISTEVENDIIIPLGDFLKENDYNLGLTVQKLLSSQHFYDADDGDNSDENIGAIVKSPLQLATEICSMFQLNIPNPTVKPVNYYNRFFHRYIHNFYLLSAGMHFFNPDSVAGYPAHYQEPDFDRHWFSSNTLIARYKIIVDLIYFANKVLNNDMKNIIDTVTFVEATISKPGDAYVLVEEIAELLYPESISEGRVKHFVNVLLDTYDIHYWSNAWMEYSTLNGDKEIVKSRIDALIVEMINAAEFQLM